MKYKVGDKVRVKSWDKMAEVCKVVGDSIIAGDILFTDSMRPLCGKILKITKIERNVYKAIGEGDADWYCWTDEMLEDVPGNADDSNNVNHPSHYNDGSIEVIDYIEDKKLGFHLGNAIKYISRAGKKDKAKTKEDIEKAIWYLQRYLEVE